METMTHEELAALGLRVEPIAREWEEARRRIPHVAAQVPAERMSAYWGKLSQDFDQIRVGDGVEEDVVRLLRDEGALRPGDEVLDVGSGPGTHALTFARTAARVTCLDYSEDMLGRLRARAEGLGNIRTVHGPWEDYEPGQRFDLVFSSFCPATNDWRSMLRMESYSCRSCCFVAASDPKRDSLQFRILDALGHEGYSNEGYDILYPFRFLYALERCPSLRVYRTFVEISRTPERMIQGQLDYLRLLMPVGDRERRVVEELVLSAPWKEGRLREPRAVGALYWDAPAPEGRGRA